MTISIRAVYTGGVLRPIQPLALEEGETVEFDGVVRHQGQPVRQGDGSDHQVVWADWRPKDRQACPHFAVLLGCGILER